MEGHTVFFVLFASHKLFYCSNKVKAIESNIRARMVSILGKGKKKKIISDFLCCQGLHINIFAVTPGLRV